MNKDPFLSGIGTLFTDPGGLRGASDKTEWETIEGSDSDEEKNYRQKSIEADVESIADARKVDAHADVFGFLDDQPRSSSHSGIVTRRHEIESALENHSPLTEQNLACHNMLMDVDQCFHER